MWFHKWTRFLYGRSHWWCSAKGRRL